MVHLGSIPSRARHNLTEPKNSLGQDCLFIDNSTVLKSQSGDTLDLVGSTVDCSIHLETLNDVLRALNLSDDYNYLDGLTGR